MRGARSSTGLLLCRMSATPDSEPAAMTTWDSAAAPFTAARRHAHQPATISLSSTGELSTSRWGA